MHLLRRREQRFAQGRPIVQVSLNGADWWVQGYTSADFARFAPSGAECSAVRWGVSRNRSSRWLRSSISLDDIPADGIVGLRPGDGFGADEVGQAGDEVFGYGDAEG